MAKKTDKTQRSPATFNLRMIKNRQEVDGCPTQPQCVRLWGGLENFKAIRNLTKFELIHNKDEHIYQAGDPVTSIYVIQSGAIKLEKQIDGGGNHVSGFYFTGDLIGTESMGLDQHHYDAIALKETWVCEIRLQKLSSLGISSAPIMEKIQAQLSNNLRQMDKHLYSSRNLYTEQRLLDLIYSLCDKDLDVADDSSNLLVLPITKSDIANYLGMRPESLSRAFRQLESEGIVKGGLKSRAIIIDNQRLQQYLGRTMIFSSCLNKAW